MHGACPVKSTFMNWHFVTARPDSLWQCSVFELQQPIINCAISISIYLNIIISHSASAGPKNLHKLEKRVMSWEDSEHFGSKFLSSFFTCPSEVILDTLPIFFIDPILVLYFVPLNTTIKSQSLNETYIKHGRNVSETTESVWFEPVILLKNCQYLFWGGGALEKFTVLIINELEGIQVYMYNTHLFFDDIENVNPGVSDPARSSGEDTAPCSFFWCPFSKTLFPILTAGFLYAYMYKHRIQ